MSELQCPSYCNCFKLKWLECLGDLLSEGCNYETIMVLDNYSYAALLFSFLKISPSKFILNKLAFSGFHFTLVIGVTNGFGESAAKNSSILSFACSAIWSELQQALWRWTWILWCHIPYVIITKSSGLDWYLSIHDSSSLKLVFLMFGRKLHSGDDHTESRPMHDHNAWIGLSFSHKHRSHNGLSVICHLIKFVFVGIESWQVRHKKIFILLGIHESQILCQNFFLISLRFLHSFPISLMLQEPISEFAGVFSILSPRPKQSIFSVVSW